MTDHDARFNRMLTDARFKKKGRRVAKLEEDDRFQLEEEPDTLDYLKALSRGEISGEDSDDSDDEEVFNENIRDSEKIEYGEGSKRVAIVNCNWTKIRAADIFALLSSFAKP